MSLAPHWGLIFWVAHYNNQIEMEKYSPEKREQHLQRSNEKQAEIFMRRNNILEIMRKRDEEEDDYLAGETYFEGD